MTASGRSPAPSLKDKGGSAMDIAMTLTAIEKMIESLGTKPPKERISTLVTIRKILEEFYNYIERSDALRDTPGAMAHISEMLEPLQVKDKALAKIRDTQWLRHNIAFLRSRKCFNTY
jgi:hypothetical protein